MTVLAELRNLTHQFDGKTVLDNITLQINEEEILALLGPNGSGKTTLLKILAFLLKPKNGEITFQGEAVTDKNTERMRLQTTLVFQRTALFSTSVFNNVAYGFKMRKTPKPVIKEEVAKALKLVKLEGYESRSAKKLSGGEQQRVALARALALNTRLLLLDEPTANLDPKNAGIIEEAVKTANRESKTTVVMATHNMFQAQSLPHRIALISDGKIGEVGPPAEIFGRLSKTLASFVITENTFPGNAKTTEKGVTLVDIGDNLQLQAATQLNGAVEVLINPNDIILSKNPVSSSARNVLKGKITEILDQGPIVKLRVNVGKLFTVNITNSSFNEMQLNLNSEVYVVFKASSVQIL